MSRNEEGMFVDRRLFNKLPSLNNTNSTFIINYSCFFIYTLKSLRKISSFVLPANVHFIHMLFTNHDVCNDNMYSYKHCTDNVGH